MRKFSITTTEGQEILGLGLNKEDVGRLLEGKKILVDLESVGIGLWRRESDGARSFLQPRDSNLVVMLGDSTEDIGKLVGIEIPSPDEMKGMSSP